MDTGDEEEEEVIPVYPSKYKEKIRKLQKELIKLGTSYSKLIETSKHNSNMAK
jgi:phage-related tail protein